MCISHGVKILCSRRACTNVCLYILSFCCHLLTLDILILSLLGHLAYKLWMMTKIRVVDGGGILKRMCVC
jgi:hypothetical protein